MEATATTEGRRTVHIDTSLLIEQQKVESKAAPVLAAIAGYVFSSTSTYARKEFKRAWLKDLGLIYKLCDGCQTIADLYDKVRQSTNHPAAKRRRERCLDAIYAFLSTLDPNKTSLSLA